MHNKINLRCVGCGHHRRISATYDYLICNYILDTGKARGCSVEECTHYTTKECHIKEDLWID